MATDTREFEIFARLWPHEAYAQRPDAFVAFVQRDQPGVTREEIEKALKDTDELSTESEASDAT